LITFLAGARHFAYMITHCPQARLRNASSHALLPRVRQLNLSKGENAMRLKGIDANNPPASIRPIFDRSRERYGRVIGPNLVMAHRPELLLAAAALGRALDGSEIVEPRLKIIASVRAAQMIGCPF
jgi:hypothetical protein